MAKENRIVYEMRCPFNEKEMVVIYFSPDEFERVKRKYDLPPDLKIKVRRWWQGTNLFILLKFLLFLRAVKFLKLRRARIRITVGYFSWLWTIISLCPDFIWLCQEVKDSAGFTEEFYLLVAHEIKHAQDNIRPEGPLIAEMERKADDFARKHKNEFKNLFIVKIVGLS